MKLIITTEYFTKKYCDVTAVDTGIYGRPQIISVN